ncbi:MAG TPA: sortase [Candidatus Paceibacterota bacterium]
MEKLERWLENLAKSLFSRNEARFIGFFAVVFIGTAGLLAALGLLPSELKESSDSGSIIESAEQAALGFLGAGSTSLGMTGQGNATQHPALAQPGTGQVGQPSESSASSNPLPGAGNNQLIVPDKLSIPSLGISTVVRNPTSTSISHLDNELTKGAVRYPGSGTIGNGNMFIFGHSTGHRVVNNQAYRVFNELKNAKKGDEILLQSGSTTFVYKVRTIAKVDKDETMVKFDTATNMLTISTCDSFGSKSDRYVVEADYVGVR